MRIANKTKEPAEADLTPMIDMTFQLIAFFMVLINFSQSEQNEKVTLPVSELAKPVETPIEFPIIVHLTSDDAVVIGGNKVSIAALGTQLQPEIDLLGLEGKTAADANIIIRSHETAPGGRVRELIERCQGIGFERFVLRVKEKVE